MSEPLQSALFDTVASMITSTPVMMDEPPIMGTIKILHCASLLISVLEQHGLSDEFLSAARVDFERDKTMSMSDPEQWATWLDDLSARFVLEVKHRNMR
jgi:hypothetical protein